MKMFDSRSLWTLALLIVCCGGASKYYSGENKPYEFGFNIDGEQHRHEKKDENGLIMGEFGFITADGVYHVTVYATDENGNFKIISMKNIRVKPYPGTKAETPERRPNPLSAPENPIIPPAQGPSSPGLSAPPGVPSTDISAPPSLSSTAVSAPSPPSIVSPVKSCSHCSLPTTTTRRPVNIQNNQNNFGPNYDLPPEDSLNNAEPHVLPLNAPENLPPRQSFPLINNYNQPGSNGLNQYQSNVNPGNSISPNLIPPVEVPSISENPAVNAPPTYESFPPYADNQNTFVNQHTPNTGFAPANNQNYPSDNALVPGNQQNNNVNNVDNLIQQHEGVINNYNSQQSPGKPTLITADLQRVPGQTNIHASAPGERDGLINGLNNGDMLDLLYTFNYTLGFHGHHESGYRNGDKKGYYYVTGRDGVRLRVDYVADSTGYHPRISQEVFGLDAPEVPKPDTEKNEEFGLKGYEFKWLYFPPGERSSS